MEIKLKIEASEIVEAINNLAEAVKVIQFKPLTWMDEYDLRQKSAQNKESLKPDPIPEPEQIKEEPTEEVKAQMPDLPWSAQEPTPEPTPEPVPKTRDDLMRLCMNLMDAGKQMPLITLLNDFGVNSLPALPDDKIEEFYRRAEGIA